MRAKAVIYDFDGVFAETEPMHYQSFLEVFNPIGITISLEYFYKLVGEPARKNIVDIKHDFNLNIDVDTYVDRLRSSYIEIVEKVDIGPLPGILESIQLARDLNMKIGLATSSPRDQAEFILNRINKNVAERNLNDNFFDMIITGDDVTNKKPAPEPYLLVSERLGVVANTCVAIEDSEAGVISAKTAGCFCIARQTAYNRHMDFSKADRVVWSIYDVVNNKFFQS